VNRVAQPASQPAQLAATPAPALARQRLPRLAPPERAGQQPESTPLAAGLEPARSAPPPGNPFHHDFSRVPATGVTRYGRVQFDGPPSPHLLAHELVHVAQQRLGASGAAASSRAQLEGEARALSEPLAAGASVPVQLAAPPSLALYGSDPDKTYTSTVGIETDDKYIKGAHEFHDKWGYKPIRVASIEEITDDLAAGTGPLSRIRIVSHASQIGLYMQFAKGGPDPVKQKELEATTQAGAEQAGVEPGASYANDGAREYFREKVIAKDAELAKRLGISKAGIKDGAITAYFRWLTNRHRLKAAPGPTKAERDLLLPAVNRQVAAARTAAETKKAASKDDLVALEKLIASTTFSWSAVSPGDALDQAIKRASATHEAFAKRDFATKQAKMRKRFSQDSTIEIRGCALGQSKPYMEAVQRYFGTPKAAPAVHAPKLYQYYGTIGLYNVDNTDRHIRFHWEKWKESKDVRDSFKKWAPVFAPTQKIPAKPTWGDFATYLRAGHALPFRSGSRLFTLKSMTEKQVIDWFTKNDQRLTAAADIKNQFTNTKVSEEATKSFLFEWLQEAYTDEPKTRIFPYDPQWAAQFETIPGKGGP
jgi:hypothetical protein